MTNLIEKTLLIGFGIFTLTIFSSTIIPFLGAIAEFNQNGKDDLETYMFFINEVDQGINYVVQNKDKPYLKNLEYPSNLNISFYANNAKYEFFIENQLCVKIKEYKENFINHNFYSTLPGLCLLNISYYISLINVNINNL